MIIYDDCRHRADAYKMPFSFGFDFIQSNAAAVRGRPKLRPLTVENCEFIRNIGLKLKKKEK